MEQGQASLASVAPSWNPELEKTDLGLVKVSKGAIPVELEDGLSTRLLAELFKGKSPLFTRRSWYGDDQAIEVALSSITFREAYSEYRQCLALLMPVGYDQLGRSRVYFDSDLWELTPETLEWLALIAQYIMADTDLDRVFIDGHTDDTHSTSYNISLSKLRAEAVTEFLVKRGVSRNQITTRYHGERFPVKTNKTVVGREQNRRVTLRLETVGERISKEQRAKDKLTTR